MNDRSRPDDRGAAASTPEEDLALGRLALEKNLLSSEQLDQAGRELQEARRRGEKPSFAKFLLDRGILEADDLLRLTAEQALLTSQAPTFSRFEIRGCLGEGASAVVYRAWDRELKRLVALKVLRLTTGMSALARSRFKREATAAAGLVHPNVVAVYDAAEEDGRPYLVMELIDGRTLHSVLAEGKTPKEALVAILEQAARGVAAAHEKGVVHRDLKPANILVTKAGEAKVADFGLAHLMDSDSLLTRSGAELGTPYYMSPEQVDGRSRESTPATDVYALGAILYELLGGAPPHARPSLQETYAAILSQDPAPLRSKHPKIHADLETICLKALEKDPKRRYPGAREFADDLRAYLTGEFIDAVSIPAWKRRLRRALQNRVLVVAASVLLLVSAGAAAMLVRQTLSSQRNLDAERELAKRRTASLQRLGTVQATILERDRELRLSRVPPEQARRDLEAAMVEVDRLVRESPEMPQGYYVRARGRMLQGDPAGAEGDLRIAVAKEPAFQPAWSLLGILKIGEYQSKLEGPRRRLDERAKSLAPVLEEARTCFAKGWTPGKELEESARWGLARTREDSVMERLSRAFQLNYNDRNRSAALALLEEADKEYQAEEYVLWYGVLWGPGSERMQRINQAIQRAPGYLPAYYLRSMYLLKDLEFAAALADLDRYLAGRAGDANGYDKRGDAKRRLGDLEGAIQDLTRAIELDPKLQSAWMNRAIVYYIQGKKAESLADYDRAVDIDPASPEALNGRGGARMKFKEWPAAFEDFNRSLQIDPNWSQTYRERGIAYVRTGEMDKALVDLDRALDLDPANYNALEARGAVRHTLGDSPGGIRDIEESLRIAPPGWPKRKEVEIMLEMVKTRSKGRNP